jgi:hypothetical protein
MVLYQHHFRQYRLTLLTFSCDLQSSHFNPVCNSNIRKRAHVTTHAGFQDRYILNHRVIILSRVLVIKTGVWINESVYWIFTSSNYKILHSQDYCNYSTCNVIHVFQFFFWPHCFSLGTRELNWSQFPFPYSHGTDYAQKTILFLRSADHMENQSPDNYLVCPLARWLLPTTSYKHSSYCCVTSSEKVFIVCCVATHVTFKSNVKYAVT